MHTLLSFPCVYPLQKHVEATQYIFLTATATWSKATARREVPLLSVIGWSRS
ncbi:unnamed protein product, partial [Gulo gulo]